MKEYYLKEEKVYESKKRELKEYLISFINFEEVNKQVENAIFEYYEADSYRFYNGNIAVLKEVLQKGYRDLEEAEYFIEKAIANVRKISCCNLKTREDSFIIWEKLLELWPCPKGTDNVPYLGRDCYNQIEEEIIEEYKKQKRDYSQRLKAFEEQVEKRKPEFEREWASEDWSEFIDI